MYVGLRMIKLCTKLPVLLLQLLSKSNDLHLHRYNPEIIETLEQYIQFQVDTNTYDFEPNLVLMKLYQFRPVRSNVDIAVKVMLKAIVVLPKPDFVLLRCVLSQPLVSLSK